jgi:L-ascorbate metabolism protein UlaG (beta-lactamase superfamily)
MRFHTILETILVIFICPLLSAAHAPGDSTATIRIKWFGQSSFLVTTTGGTNILIDPANFKGYHFPDSVYTDIVTVSHEHIDHNYVEGALGSPAIFRGTDDKCQKVNSIDTTIKGIRFYSISSYHNPVHTAVNAIFVYEFDGLRLVHLGDIGHILTDDQIRTIGKVDILMVPVGGKYTIAAAEADTIVNQLDVKHLVIPMHYKTDAFPDLPYTAEPFLKGKENVRRIDNTYFIIDPATMPEAREYVLLRY